MVQKLSWPKQMKVCQQGVQIQISWTLDGSKSEKYKHKSLHAR